MLRKDSSFSRQYDGLFPSANITWQADSSNSFTLTAGRRIDRAGFSKSEPVCVHCKQVTLMKQVIHILSRNTHGISSCHINTNLFLPLHFLIVLSAIISRSFFLQDSSGIFILLARQCGKGADCRACIQYAINTV